MKKALAIAITVALVLVVIAGCSSPPPPQPAPQPAPEPAPEQPQQQMDLPGFYLNPPVADDAIYGVGSAKMSSLDTSRRMAVSRAREDIAFQMNAQIQAAVIDYFQEAGVDDNTQVVSFVENISRQVTETTLSGARTEEVYAANDGSVYALVSYPLNGFMEAAAEAFQRNEDAAFAEFKADQALEYLDSVTAGSPSQAGQSGQ